MRKTGKQIPEPEARNLLGYLGCKSPKYVWAELTAMKTQEVSFYHTRLD